MRDSCGWCLYRIQGCGVIVAIFCPCGDVKPHLRLRIGGSWWVERVVSACVPKDPYARGAEQLGSTLEYIVAVVRFPCVSVQDKMSRTNANKQPRTIILVYKTGHGTVTMTIRTFYFRVCTCQLLKTARTAGPCFPFVYASTMAFPFVFQLLCAHKADVQAIKSCKQCIHLVIVSV